MFVFEPTVDVVDVLAVLDVEFEFELLSLVFKEVKLALSIQLELLRLFK